MKCQPPKTEPLADDDERLLATLAGLPAMSDPIPCFQTRRSIETCRACGKGSAVVHLPTKYTGYYCEKCCPACNPKPAPKGE
jgi:hypothetical protein